MLEPEILKQDTFIVHRLIDEVINEGRLDVLDELYAPALARGARMDRAVSEVVPRYAHE